MKAVGPDIFSAVLDVFVFTLLRKLPMSDNFPQSHRRYELLGEMETGNLQAGANRVVIVEALEMVMARMGAVERNLPIYE